MIKYLKYIAAAITILVLGFLLLANATTLIYIVCSVLCTAAVVVYVFIFYLRYIDKTNEPKRIIVEGLSRARNANMEYERNLDRLKAYFESRYTMCPVKIVYLPDESGPKPVVYISTESAEDRKRIQHVIESLFSDGQLPPQFVDGLPTI